MIELGTIYTIGNHKWRVDDVATLDGETIISTSCIGQGCSLKLREAEFLRIAEYPITAETR